MAGYSVVRCVGTSLGGEEVLTSEEVTLPASITTDNYIVPGAKIYASETSAEDAIMFRFT